jgi:DNA modification methylase
MKPYYEHAGITIYHGDCEAIAPSLEQFGLLLTDPPYGIGAARKKFGGHGVKQHKTGLAKGKCIYKRDYGDAGWDDVPCSNELLTLNRNICDEAIIWGGNYFTLPPTKSWLVWDKLRGDTDFADGEMAWCSVDRAMRIFRYRWNGFLVDSTSTDDRLHPTQKPLALMKWCIAQAGDGVHSILDPFMGSGTTLVASKAFGIRAVGIEREEAYCEIAAKRLSQSVFNFEEVA